MPSGTAPSAIAFEYHVTLPVAHRPWLVPLTDPGLHVQEGLECCDELRGRLPEKGRTSGQFILTWLKSRCDVAE